MSAQVRESRNLRAESSASLANLAVVAFALLDVHIAAKHAVKESRELRRWIDDLGEGPVLRVQGQEVRREPFSLGRRCVEGNASTLLSSNVQTVADAARAPLASPSQVVALERPGPRRGSADLAQLLGTRR